MHIGKQTKCFATDQKSICILIYLLRKYQCAEPVLRV